MLTIIKPKAALVSLILPGCLEIATLHGRLSCQDVSDAGVEPAIKLLRKHKSLYFLPYFQWDMTDKNHNIVAIMGS